MLAGARPEKYRETAFVRINITREYLETLLCNRCIHQAANREWICREWVCCGDLHPFTGGTLAWLSGGVSLWDGSPASAPVAPGAVGGCLSRPCCRPLSGGDGCMAALRSGGRHLEAADYRGDPTTKGVPTGCATRTPGQDQWSLFPINVIRRTIETRGSLSTFIQPNL
jgi:hypothetical protein